MIRDPRNLIVVVQETCSQNRHKEGSLHARKDPGPCKLSPDFPLLFKVYGFVEVLGGSGGGIVSVPRTPITHTVTPAILIMNSKP